MAGKMSDFWGFLKPKGKIKPDLQEQQIFDIAKRDPFREQKRVYHGGEEPLRQLVLWGRDQQNNPGFVILYGEHQFKKNAGRVHELEDEVTYTNYYIVNGCEGHLPSFEAVEIRNVYDRANRTYVKAMYYKKDLKAGVWNVDPKLAVKGYQPLKTPVKIPYFYALTHQDYQQLLQAAKIQWPAFEVLADPVVLFKPFMNPELTELIGLFGHPNLYMRKKCLTQLLEQQPSKELLQLILTIGSGEVIAGLFLELSKRKDPVLLPLAPQIVADDLGWLSDAYRRGVKRCVTIYQESLQPDLQGDRVAAIRSRLPELDLQLLPTNTKTAASDQALEGIDFRKLMVQGSFSEYISRYEKVNGSYCYVKERRQPIYQESYYCDGVVLHKNRLKDTLQQAEIYGLADVMGRLAYYCDAPKLVYYFKGSGNAGALRYFQRYLRRVINNYAQHEEEKFVEAVSTLALSYHDTDYLCKFPGNFQYNYFIKYYLYQRFTGEQPQQWAARREWVRTDQLLKLDGRWEACPQIWDRHLDVVIRIIQHAQIEVVRKAFYMILRDSEQKEECLAQLSDDTLIALSEVSYQPAAAFFINIIRQRLEQAESVDYLMLFRLMDSDSEVLAGVAQEYLNKCPAIGAEHLISLLQLNHFERWEEPWGQALLALDGAQYSIFLKRFFAQADQLGAHHSYSQECADRLALSTKIIASWELEQKTELVTWLLKAQLPIAAYTEFSLELAERVLFTLTNEELAKILNLIAWSSPAYHQRKRLLTITAALSAIQQQMLLPEGTLIEALTTGTSMLIQRLYEHMSSQADQLQACGSTLLIMMESGITTFQLLAQSVFEQMPANDQKRFHSQLLDSPDQDTYTFGLLKLQAWYEQPGVSLPKEFVLQMLEHPAQAVRSYLSDQLAGMLEQLGAGDQELFLYYAKTVLLLPNKMSVQKQRIYELLPAFVKQYSDRTGEVEELLLDLGGSNTCADAERALVTLAAIKKGGVFNEG